MYIISSFQHSLYLEVAITNLEKKGIPKENILAVPLKKRRELKKLFDTINQSDGVSQLDTAAILGTIASIFGIIYGYSLKWGPLLWGLIGLFSGFILGFIIDIIPKRRKRLQRAYPNSSDTEVVVIIQCETEQAQFIEKVLWENLALGVGRFDG